MIVSSTARRGRLLLPRPRRLRDDRPAASSHPVRAFDVEAQQLAMPSQDGRVLVFACIEGALRYQAAGCGPASILLQVLIAMTCSSSSGMAIHNATHPCRNALPRPLNNSG